MHVELYDRIGKLQLHLGQKERDNIILSYYQDKKELDSLLYKDPQCQKLFKDICSDIINNNRSLTKLSDDYNRNTSKSKKIDPLIRTELKKNPPDIEHILEEINCSEALTLKLIEVSNKTPIIEELLSNIKTNEDILVRSLLELGAKIAMKYSYMPNIEAEDIIQISQIMILQAIRRYDPFHKKKAKLSSFVYRRVSDQIKEWVLNNSRQIKVPRQKLARLFIITNAANQLPNPGTIEIMNKANELTKKPFDFEEVTSLIDIWRSVTLRLDHPISRDPSDTPDAAPEDNTKHALYDYIPDPSMLIDQELSNKDNLKEILIRASKVLNPKELEIIKLKYLQDRKISDTEIGRELKVSREDIRKRLALALEKLREQEDLRDLLC